MILRLIFVFSIFVTMGMQALAQPSPEEALAGLKKYAAAMDAIESATFYYKRTIFSPALSEKDAVKCAIQMMNSMFQQFPAGNAGIATVNFIDQINQQKESMKKESRRSYIHRIGFAKDFLSDAQFRANGKMMFSQTINGSTLTTVDQVSMAMNGEGKPSIRSMPMRPEQKWLTDLLRWRRALELIASATPSVSAIDGGRFLLKIETNSVYGDQTVMEIYELELQKQGDFYVPVVYRTIFESSTQNLMYENYVFRNGLPLPSSIRQENVPSKREMIIFRPSEMSFTLLPEEYKLGDPVE